LVEIVDQQVECVRAAVVSNALPDMTFGHEPARPQPENREVDPALGVQVRRHVEEGPLVRCYRLCGRAGFGGDHIERLAGQNAGLNLIAKRGSGGVDAMRGGQSGQAAAGWVGAATSKEADNVPDDRIFPWFRPRALLAVPERDASPPVETAQRIEAAVVRGWTLG
jgi:hypothetical protein